MASRATWKGSIGFGMVNVPVNLFKATDDKDISFNNLHAACGTKIEQHKICPKCNRKVEQSELISGKQIGDTWITISEQEKESVAVKSMKTMEVFEFVPVSALDPRHFGESHFLAPDKNGLKAFNLLLKAMEKENRVAITKYGSRNKEKLACVRPFGTVMLLQELKWADELRDKKDVSVELPDVSEKELNLGIALLKSLENDSPDMAKYRDTYREALDDMIEKKILGQPVVVKPVEVATPTDDLVGALMASLNKAPPVAAGSN